MIALFQDALMKEIQELKKGRGGKRFEVYDGYRIYSSREVYVYRFITDQSLKDDTPVSVIIKNQSINGHIVSSDPEGINIGLDADMGEIVEQATIHSSAVKLLENLVKKFSKARSGDISLNLDGSMKLFGFLEPGDLSNPISFSEEKTEGYKPNTEQQIAILRSLTQEVTFIWGPPGTGKTKTLGIILNQLIQAGKSVLLTSHTNTAVDEILKKFVENEENTPYIEAGKIIRHGTPSVSNDRFNNLLIDNIVERRTLEEQKKLKKLGNQINSIDRKIKKIKTYEKEVHTITALIETHTRELKTEETVISNLRKRISLQNTENNKIATNLSEQRRLLEKAKTSNFLKRMLLGLKVEKIEKDISVLETKLKISELELQSHESELNDLKEKRDSIKEKIIQLTYHIEDIVPIDGLTSLEQLGKKIREMSREVIDKQSEMKKIQAIITALREDIFNKALVIGCTLTRAYLDSKVFSRKFSVLIVDEASNATLPSMFFVSGLSSNHYIVSGDFRQLSPIAISNDKSVAMWLKRDIFVQSGIVKSVDLHVDDKRIVMLKEQYRMHPDICAIVSDFVYNGQLKTAENVKIAKQQIAALPPLEDKALIFCDTSNANPWIIRSNTSISRLSPYSAVVASRLALKLLDEANRKDIEINVGIVTPYSAQAQLISKILEDEYIDRKQVVASTIHKFQGNERDCVIFDLVEGQPFSPGILTKGPFVGSEPGRLINVAISRAEGKLILIGNGDYIKRKFHTEDAVFQMIEKIKENGEALNSLNILSTSFDNEPTIADRRKDKKILASAFSILNEKNFFKVFREDLKRAKSSLVILSPFIARKRLRTLKKDLISSIKRGIRVYIITRHPDHQGTNKQYAGKLIKEIRKIGARVIVASKKIGLHEKFHDKIAVIDNSVFYHGSMNILSQSNSSESMIVFRARKTIKELLRIFGIKKIIRRYQNLTGETSDTLSIIQAVEKKILEEMNPGDCPQCGKKLILVKGRKDLHFGCPNLLIENCNFQKKVDKTLVEKAIDSIKLQCRKCHTGLMVYREGKFGPFLGCNKYRSSHCRGLLNFDEDFN